MTSHTTIPHPHGNGDNDNRAALGFFQDVMKTREVREALGFIVPEICNLWAGESPVKKKIARPLARMVSEGICPKSGNGSVSFIDAGAFVNKMDGVVPVLFGAATSVLEAALSGMESLPIDQRTHLLKGILRDGAGKRAGEVLNRCICLINACHETNPRFLADWLIPVFQSWYETTDFGELRDFLDGAGPEINACAERVNDILWQYPAKLVLMLSALPDAVNAVGGVTAESVSRFNTVSPDIVADIVLSLFRQIDGNILGKCVNEAAELIRKLHTGSALIGDPGSPQFIQDLAELMAPAMDHIDGEKLSKARIAVAQSRESVGKAMTDAMAANAEIWMTQLSAFGEIKNTELRTAQHRLEALVDLPNDQVTDAMETGLSVLDIQAAAEIVNLSSTLLNRLMTASPKTVEGLATQFSDGLDLHGVSEMAETLLPMLGESLRPIGRAVLPGVIRELCTWLEPSDDPYEEAMADAKNRLRSLIVGEEALV